MREYTYFTYEMLIELLAKDNATLISNITIESKLNNKTSIEYKCHCGNTNTKTFLYLRHTNAGAFCRSCTLKRSRDKFKQTNEEKFGGHPMRNKEIKEKVENTCLERYGSKNISQTDTFKESYEKNIIQKYGSLEIYYKLRRDNQKISIKKLKQTNPEYIKNIVEKREHTCLEKYGETNASKVDSVKEKFKNTSMKIYGVKNPAQSLVVQEKHQQTSYKFKKYVMPSGNIRRVQGYEPWALDELVKNYNEEDIVTSRKDIPNFTYIEDKIYFPDIYIKSINTIIEVKSTYTIQNTKNLLEKINSVGSAGFNCELWMYTKGKTKEVFTPYELALWLEQARILETLETEDYQ